MKEHIQRLNSYALSVIEHVGLMVISVATVVSMASEILKMYDRLEVTLSDLLMLFLYLEVIAMVQRYYTSGKMPVRFPLYIAIVALARYMILDMKLMTEWRMMAIAAAILILALAILLIRYGHVRFPYSSDENLQRSEHREERD
ncbi:MAG: phosphate-starvation-inducible PsiE family protein [Betaproteobacteria bacterium]|nr:phosphate-starvation-inducible PsiE family protein [Betaproteobacteria bacterium]